MRTFDVYKHPSQEYQAVKQGFGWPAFFFTAIWALVKNMWGLGCAFLCVIFLLSFANTAFEQGGSQAGIVLVGLAHLAFDIIVGIKGNDWRRGYMVKRGFEKLKTVEAPTPVEAINSVVQPSTEQQED